MKPSHLWIASALLASLGLGAAAQTPPAPESQPRVEAQQRMERHMARRAAQLKQKLALTPAQEPAWNAWTESIKPAGAMRQRPDREAFAKLTTPERIDRMRALRAERMARMDQRADATKTFYAVLTPEQKKVFDQETLRMHKRGMHQRRHHG
jgi:protein CpxP